jgi:hypothetical protein
MTCVYRRIRGLEEMWKPMIAIAKVYRRIRGLEVPGAIEVKNWDVYRRMRGLEDERIGLGQV